MPINIVTSNINYRYTSRIVQNDGRLSSQLNLQIDKFKTLDMQIAHGKYLFDSKKCSFVTVISI